MKMCFVRKALSFKGEQIVFWCIWGALFQHLVMALSLKAMIVVKNGFRRKLGFENTSPQKVHSLCAKCSNTFGPRPGTNEAWAGAKLWPFILGPKRARRNLHNPKLIWLDLTVQRQEENQWMAAGGAHRTKHLLLHHVTPLTSPPITLQASIYSTRGAAISLKSKSWQNIDDHLLEFKTTCLFLRGPEPKFCCVAQICSSQRRQMLHIPRANTTRLQK